VLFIRTAGSITTAANRQAIDVTAREDGQDWVRTVSFRASGSFVALVQAAVSSVAAIVGCFERGGFCNFPSRVS